MQEIPSPLEALNAVEDYKNELEKYHQRIEKRKAELGMMNRKQRRAVEAKAKKFEKIYKKK